MTREEILICMLLCVIVMAIYTYFVKWKSYQEGFSYGIKYYSSMVKKEILDHINRLNKEAEETGIDIAYVESIRPLNEKESEG